MNKSKQFSSEVRDHRRLKYADLLNPVYQLSIAALYQFTSAADTAALGHCATSGSAVVPHNAGSPMGQSARLGRSARPRSVHGIDR